MLVKGLAGFISVIGLTVLLAVGHLQAAVPAGFTTETVAANLTVPVAIRFAPDGNLFVAEKFGTIKVVHPDGQIHTFGRLTVNGEYEQGLLGIVLDPDFATNGYVYVDYTNADGLSNRISRITSTLTAPYTLVAGSEKVLLDNIPSPTGIHQMGELQIAPDGKLYASSGDGAIDSTAGQNLGNLGGKILRINTDGTIPPDNPFVGFPGARPEIWAYGLRNPWTSAIQPVTGRFFVNDVGNDTWEEINELQKGGNFGWRTCEGRCNPARPGFIDPVYQYNHSSGAVTGRSIAGGAWYTGTAYPSGFEGTYLFGDYVSGWVKRLDPASGQVTDLAEGLPGLVNLKVGPDGMLYMVQLNVNTGAGSIKRLRYGQATPPPGNGGGAGQLKIFAAGTPAGGQYPDMQLLIDDTVVATYTGVAGNPGAGQFNQYTYDFTGDLKPEQVKLNYPNDANFNGQDRNLYVDRIEIGNLVMQTEAASTYSTGTWSPGNGCGPGNKQSEVLSCNGFFQYGPAPAPTIPANQKPAAVISTPAAAAHYNAGDTVSFSGSGTDAEDGALPAANLSWNIVFHHDMHSHPFLTIPATAGGTFTIPDTGEPAANTWYRLHLTATDSVGQTTEVTRDIVPNTAQVTLAANISGVTFELDGDAHAAPYTFTGVTGFQRSISAPATQTVGQAIYDFVSWSDGGDPTHTIATPSAATTYTANYELREGSPPPGSTLQIFAAGTPAGGTYPSMQLQVGGQAAQTYTDVQGNPATRQFTTYTYQADHVLTPSEIRLAFTNDTMTGGEDRNLYIDHIEIDGTPFETEDISTLSTGTWSPGNGCGPGNKQSEVLACNGYFQFNGPAAPGSGSQVAVYAAGTPAQGVYPAMELHIGGQTLFTENNVTGDPGARQFLKYVYNLTQKLTNEPVEVYFTNDANVNGQDRNLFIDKIEIDGVTYDSENPAVYSVGSWSPSNGCGGGNKSSETLACNGYFKYR